MNLTRENMKSSVAIATGLAVIFVILALIYGRPVIQNDGISYYALTASLVEDHDFRLENQFKEHPEVRVIHHHDGTVASYYSCGYAFLYAPMVFLLDHFTDLEAQRPYAQNVKFPFSHALGIFLGSVLYGFLSVLFAYFLLVRRGILNPLSAFLISLAVFLGTPLLFYTFTVPSFAHAGDTFLLVCIFSLAVSPNRLAAGAVRFRNVLLGFVLAFSVLLRNNNAVIVPVIVLGVLYFDREKRWKTCLEIFGGAIPILLVHSLFNLDQYGKFFATGYDVRITTEQAQYRFLRFFFIFFHPAAGIYPWSPIALLSTAGLILAAIKKDRACVLALAVVIVVIVSIRFAAVIFPGSTFGQRLLTHLYIFWVLGLAQIFVRWRRMAVLITCLCVLWSFTLFNTYYTLTGSDAGKVMTKKGGSSPTAWLRACGENYAIAKQSDDKMNLFSFWYQSLGTRPYPTLIHLISRNSKDPKKGH